MIENDLKAKTDIGNGQKFSFFPLLIGLNSLYFSQALIYKMNIRERYDQKPALKTEVRYDV